MVIINGTTGIDTIQDGKVVDADLNLSVKPMFSAYQSGSTSCPHATTTKIALNTKEYDPTNAYDATNSRFTPQKAGFYQVNVCITLTAAVGNLQTTIFKNGIQYKAISIYSSNSGNITSPMLSCIVYLNGTTDFIEAYGYQTSGAALSTISGRNDITYFQAHYISTGV